MSYTPSRKDNVFLSFSKRPVTASESPPPPLPPLKDNPALRWVPADRGRAQIRNLSRIDDSQWPKSQLQEYDNDSPPAIKHWPTKPRSLKESVNFISILYTVGDYLLAILPVTFLVLCGLAAQLNGAPTENNQLGVRVKQAMQLGPTIFPMMFSAVAGRTTKMIARYLAESGAKLGTLELLVASQTVWGTFESQLLLRRLSVVGAHLLILWSLSPLGGQASLRLLDSSTAATSSVAKVRYLDTGAACLRSSIFGIGGNNPEPVNAVYVASLMASSNILNGPQDTWGNVKIPRIEQLSGPDQDGWMEVPQLTSADNYTSLVGIPWAGILDGDATFNLEATYMRLECPPWLEVPYYTTSNLANWTNYLGQIYSNKYHPNYGTPFMTSADLITDFLLDTDLELNNTARTRALMNLDLTTSEAEDPMLNRTRRITYLTIIPSEDNFPEVLISKCAVYSSHVEASAECTNDTSCVITKMRQSLVDTRSPVLTPIDMFPSGSGMLLDFAWATPVQSSGTSTKTEMFLANTTISPYHFQSQASSNVNLTTLSPELLGIRLAMVLNTYYQISLGPLAFDGGLPTDLSIYGPDNITSLWNELPEPTPGVIENAPFVAGTSFSTVTKSYEIFVTNYLWLALLATSSGLLLGIGVVGLVLKHISHAPDMLGYVSSITYQNPYLALPPGGGPLDGMERARVLKDVRVRIMDVEGLNKVGHVALATTDDKAQKIATGSIKPLERKRTYF